MVSRPCEKKIKQAVAWRTLNVELPSLELVKGHDGFLRGKPEPVLICVAYGVYGSEVRLLERALRRLRLSGQRFPLTVVLADGTLFRYSLQQDCQQIVLLLVALEEDNGADVLRIYGGLAEPSQLRIWASNADLPAPLTLAEAGQLASPPTPGSVVQVNLLHAQSDLRDLCQVDKWIGANLLVVPSTKGRWTKHVRFLAVDERNDWTARLVLRI